MWNSFFKSPSSPSTRCRPTRCALASRLGVEPLEDRCLLSGYTLTLLDGPEGAASAKANDINASGQVVGAAWMGAFDDSWGHHALLWNNGGVMIDLGSLGGQYSSALAINDRGQIVGGTTRSDNSGHHFLINPLDTDGNGTPDCWFQDDNGDGANDLMVELPLTGGFPDINNVGQVVAGRSLWTPTTPNGTTGSLTTLGLSANAINDAGQVVGSDVITGRASLWQNGAITDLGTGGIANDINASGQVTGYFLQADFRSAGFLWTPTAPNGTVGTYTVLTPPDSYDYASGSGLNNLGQVVGNMGFFSSPGGDEGGGVEADQFATLWVGGKPQVLANSWYFLEQAEAINGAGQIVGYTAFGKGAFFGLPPFGAYLLTPIISDATVTEGNAGTRVATFTVMLPAASSQSVAVAYATANGTATAGIDYQATSGTLTFAPGETRKTISVLVNGDRLGEANETFRVNLSGAMSGVGVGTILDDEPRITISDFAKAEGQKGLTTLFTFTVTLSVAYDQAVTMSFKTVDGTAKKSDKDYIAKTGTVTFAAGETTKTITVEVKGDSKKEADETFYLDLFGLNSNALFTKNRGLGTIVNDD